MPERISASDLGFLQRIILADQIAQFVEVRGRFAFFQRERFAGSRLQVIADFMDGTQPVFGKERAGIIAEAGADAETRGIIIIFLELKKTTRECMSRVEYPFRFFEVDPRAGLAARALLRALIAIYLFH